MVGIGPFIPHQDTPLAGSPAGTMFMTLKTLSLIRVLLPNANIPATTAMASISKTGRQRALKAGANVIMPNYTNPKFRGMYDLYNGKVCVSEDPSKNRINAEKIAIAAGKKIVDGIGQARKELVGI
jgi:biotin synthase